MITGINQSKILAKHNSNVNVILMEESVTQINNGITWNFDVSV